MDNTSQQDDYSITLSDEQLAALSSIDTSTITLNSGCYTSPCYTYSSGSSYYTATTATTSSFCIPNISINSINIWGNNEFVDSFPAWSRIEKMCEEYPGLKLAFDKFKNTYNLVKDDFDLPPEKRIKP